MKILILTLVLIALPWTVEAQEATDTSEVFTDRGNQEWLLPQHEWLLDSSIRAAVLRLWDSLNAERATLKIISNQDEDSSFHGNVIIYNNTYYPSDSCRQVDTLWYWTSIMADSDSVAVIDTFYVRCPDE